MEVSRRSFIKGIGILFGALACNKALISKELLITKIKQERYQSKKSSGNTLLTPDIIAKEALIILKNNLRIMV